MNPEPGSLLIADDDAGDRSLLRRYFESRGFVVAEAQDGDQALALLGGQSFDLVLLDVVMPGVSGLEVLGRLRQRHSATALPVIMATARDQSTDVVQALRLGANDYVTKPFDFPVVLARARTQLSLKRSVDRITRLEQSLAQRNADLEAANTELANANRHMRRDLEAAARVQQALLPRAVPSRPGAAFAWEFKPCAELAGDLLNVVALDDRHMCLYVLDVVDHGVKAALLAVMVNRVLARLHASARLGPPASPSGPSPLPPAEVAAHLSQEFPWDEYTQQFFTLLYGILDLHTGDFRFISAGHPGPLYLPQGAQARVFKVPGLPIGLSDGSYEEHRLTLGPGDRLYLYSDGLTEAMSEEGKTFGEERLRAVLEDSRSEPLPDGLAALIRRVGDWCGPVAPHDDITILAVEVTGQA